VTGVQTCALPISMASALREKFETHRSVSGEIFTDPFREYRGEELQV